MLIQVLSVGCSTNLLPVHARII